MKRKFQRWLYSIYRAILTCARWTFFGMDGAWKKELPTPSIVITNHCSFFDPLLLIIKSRQPIFFVASEHLFSSRFRRFFTEQLCGMIPCSKGKQNLDATRKIVKALKQGDIVGLLAEGGISYDGTTQPIMPATGKLAKISGASLVTVRTYGSYYLKPRWSTKTGRSQVKCEIVGIYSPEELKKMKPDEVNEIIERDIHIEPEEYKVNPKMIRRGTDGIDILLGICPVCESMRSIEGRGHEIVCTHCGARGTLKPDDHIESSDFRFHTLHEWNMWEKEYLGAGFEWKDRDEILNVTDVSLDKIGSDHKRECVETGEMKLTRQGMECGHHIFPMEDIAFMDTYVRGVLVFDTRKGDYYEVTSKKAYPGLLYTYYWQGCVDREKARKQKANS